MPTVKATKAMCKMTTHPCFVPDSKRSWVISVFPFGTSPRPVSWRLTSWKPRTWRRWTSEDCQVNTHILAYMLRLAIDGRYDFHADYYDSISDIFPLSQIRLLRWCCSTMGSGWRRRRHQSNRTLWILTSMRASASRSPSPRSRFGHFSCGPLPFSSDIYSSELKMTHTVVDICWF